MSLHMVRPLHGGGGLQDGSEKCTTALKEPTVAVSACVKVVGHCWDKDGW